MAEQESGNLVISVSDLVETICQSRNKDIGMQDVGNLIPEFSADADEDIVGWLERVEGIMTVYGVEKKRLLLIALSKLRGRALRWFNSCPKHIELDYEQFKVKISEMFTCKEDKVRLMRKFETRKWMVDESFSDYFNDKIILGNKLKLEEKDMIIYIIEGLNNPSLQCQAKMKEFTSLGQMLRVMSDITSYERNIKASVIAPKFIPTLDRKSPNMSVKLHNNQSITSSIPSSGTTFSKAKYIRCYNCAEVGHVATHCTKKKRKAGSCFHCGSTEHQLPCPNKEERRGSGNGRNREEPDSTTSAMLIEDLPKPYVVDIYFEKLRFTSEAVIDTGSPISLIKEDLVLKSLIRPYSANSSLSGINKSKLEILGIYVDSIVLFNFKINLTFYVVKNSTMICNILLGRNLMMHPNIELSFRKGKVEIHCKESQCHLEFLNNEVLLIDEYGQSEAELKINNLLPQNIRLKTKMLIHEHYINCHKPIVPKSDFKMHLTLNKHDNFVTRPRRLSYGEKNALDEIITDLLNKGIIRESISPYCSNIVLVKKKTGDYRMCVDYRILNKYLVRDQFPMPVIDDLLDCLKNAKYYTKLDLKNAFYHVSLDEESVKYTSFVTPSSQYEFLRMPFGLCNSPQTFSRFIYEIFKDLIKAKKILIYLDDILIATDTIEENLEILVEAFKILTDNLLELRLDKCSFLDEEIIFLGYIVNKYGIRPSGNNISAIKNYPLPINIKQVHSFIGLTSYFRRFIKNYSIIAKPLFDLLKKEAKFEFGPKCVSVFEELKAKLCSEPILSIYSPLSETQLHCDASSVGFGSILMQKQVDGKFHPVFYFSKRTTECESKYHSYELETLAVVYALKRFHVYLHGIPFKIITDCDSFRLTLTKRDIIPRIMRWTLLLQNYDYTIEHRSNVHMKHVDALSRIQNILVLEGNTLDQTLAIKQGTDPDIVKIREMLEKSECKVYEMRNGLVYRKYKDKILFYVPRAMEFQILQLYHNDSGHFGIEKTYELIIRTYWFPKLKQKICEHISNCLKCIEYSPKSGKREGVLSNIPKGDLPFETLHIDHYGPLECTGSKNKYIFEIIDGFTKFIKFYACRTTKTNELIKHLKSYFNYYSVPKVIVADRGSCFTSKEFKLFVESYGIKLNLIASGAPWANGQIERMNRVLTPVLSKLTDNINKWDTVLDEVTFCFNNSVSRSTGQTPSKLLFGRNQIGKIKDNLRLYLESVNEHDCNLEEIRKKASDQIKEIQRVNKDNYDKHHKTPLKYNVGDCVMVANVDTTIGVNKKLVPRYRGPYIIKAILPNGRYVVNDIIGFQCSSIPYTGILEASRLKPYTTEN